MLVPVGVVSSSDTVPPYVIISVPLNISNIAYAGFDVNPCENVTVPPPIAIGEQIISSSKRFRSSSAIAVPRISITVSILAAS